MASRVLKRTLATLTHSAVAGPTHPPLVHSTLPAFFTDHILAQHAARPALICRSEDPAPYGGPVSLGSRYLKWDYAALDAHVAALARGLVGLGVRKGDRVGVVMGNNSAYAMLQWAAARIGAILVTLNPAYRVHELITTLRLVGVSHLFVVPAIRTSRYLDILASELPGFASAKPGQIQEEKLPDLKQVVVLDDLGRHGREEWMDQLERVQCAVDFREILVWRQGASEDKVVRDLTNSLTEDEIINLQFTSGTTGAPKAVSLTHHNLLNNGIQIGRCMRLTPEDVLCNVPPLFHCFGLVLGNLAAFTHGSAVVYPSPVFNPPAIVDAVLGVQRTIPSKSASAPVEETVVESEKCTALHGVPTHFLGVLSEVEQREDDGETMDFSRLRTGIAAGSTIPIALMRKLIEKLNLTELTIAYGMTETSPVTFQTMFDDALDKRVETVGRIHPHIRAKIIDTEGKVVPVGTPGELVVAGYALQKGYWDDPEQTAQVMRHDEEGTLWMYTGDEGVLDNDGYLRIVGRIKDIIIRGGENLFPVQIENTLTAHPGIREAAVVSVPDTRFGEVVGAWIVRDPHWGHAHFKGERKEGHTGGISMEEVREVVAKGMNPQNAPAWVWFVGEQPEYDELPKTASGKVMKHVLRKWSKELSAKGVGKVG